jgi:hypothetical protein
MGWTMRDPSTPAAFIFSKRADLEAESARDLGGSLPSAYGNFDFASWELAQTCKCESIIFVVIASVFEEISEQMEEVRRIRETLIAANNRIMTKLLSKVASLLVEQQI